MKKISDYQIFLSNINKIANLTPAAEDHCKLLGENYNEISLFDIFLNDLIVTWKDTFANFKDNTKKISSTEIKKVLSDEEKDVSLINIQGSQNYDKYNQALTLYQANIVTIEDAHEKRVQTQKIKYRQAIEKNDESYAPILSNFDILLDKINEKYSQKYQEIKSRFARYQLMVDEFAKARETIYKNKKQLLLNTQQMRLKLIENNILHDKEQLKEEVNQMQEFLTSFENEVTKITESATQLWNEKISAAQGRLIRDNIVYEEEVNGLLSKYDKEFLVEYKNLQVEYKDQVNEEEESARKKKEIIDKKLLIQAITKTMFDEYTKKLNKNHELVLLELKKSYDGRVSDLFKKYNLSEAEYLNKLKNIEETQKSNREKFTLVINLIDVEKNIYNQKFKTNIELQSELLNYIQLVGESRNAIRRNNYEIEQVLDRKKTGIGIYLLEEENTYFKNKIEYTTELISLERNRLYQFLSIEKEISLKESAIKKQEIEKNKLLSLSEIDLSNGLISIRLDAKFNKEQVDNEYELIKSKNNFDYQTKKITFEKLQATNKRNLGEIRNEINLLQYLNNGCFDSLGILVEGFILQLRSLSIGGKIFGDIILNVEKSSRKDSVTKELQDSFFLYLSNLNYNDRVVLDKFEKEVNTGISYLSFNPNIKIIYANNIANTLKIFGVLLKEANEQLEGAYKKKNDYATEIKQLEIDYKKKNDIYLMSQIQSLKGKIAIQEKLLNHFKIKNQRISQIQAKISKLPQFDEYEKQSNESFNSFIKASLEYFATATAQLKSKFLKVSDYENTISINEIITKFSQSCSDLDDEIETYITAWRKFFGESKNTLLEQTTSLKNFYTQKNNELDAILDEMLEILHSEFSDYSSLCKEINILENSIIKKTIDSSNASDKSFKIKYAEQRNQDFVSATSIITQKISSIKQDYSNLVLNFNELKNNIKAEYLSQLKKTDLSNRDKMKKFERIQSKELKELENKKDDIFEKDNKIPALASIRNKFVILSKKQTLELTKKYEHLIESLEEKNKEEVTPVTP